MLAPSVPGAQSDVLSRHTSSLTKVLDVVVHSPAMGSASAHSESPQSRTMANAMVSRDNVTKRASPPVS